MSKWYVGSGTKGVREVFAADTEPTFESHSHLYYAIKGPFKTKRGAIYMAKYGKGNPKCQTVSQAETLAKKKGQGLMDNVINYWLLEVHDLWRYDGCWSSNQTYRQIRLKIPEGTSDTALSRIFRDALEITGNKYCRRDHWAGTEFCWRNGTLGYTAEVYESVYLPESGG